MEPAPTTSSRVELFTPQPGTPLVAVVRQRHDVRRAVRPQVQEHIPAGAGRLELACLPHVNHRHLSPGVDTANPRHHHRCRGSLKPTVPLRRLPGRRHISKLDTLAARQAPHLPRSDRPPVPVMHLPGTSTGGLPPPIRHRFTAQGVRGPYRRTHLSRVLPPQPVMLMPRPGQRMRDLMPHRFAHLIPTVQPHHVPRQADNPPTVVTHPGPPDSVIEHHPPTRIPHTELFQQRFRPVFGFTQFHTVTFRQG